MKNRRFTIIIILVIIAIIIVCFYLYSNTSLKEFEKEITNFVLPENVEKIAIKSGVGDSGGNGDYSTYRVVMLVKTEIPIEELNKEFEKRNLTFSSYIPNSGNPICYITHCEDKVFKSMLHFKLTFDELENIEDYSNYYFIEFIK